VIRSLDIMALTQFLKDRHTPAMLAGTNRDPPACTKLSALVGINHPLITLKASGNKLQASSGTMETLTTTINNTMKKYQVTIREDVCLSLTGAIMTNWWTSTASTIA